LSEDEKEGKKHLLYQDSRPVRQPAGPGFRSIGMPPDLPLLQPSDAQAYFLLVATKMAKKGFSNPASGLKKGG
jgi:hypothetical protein